MAKTKKKDFHTRKFLTKPGEADSYVHVSYYNYGTIDFKLADCTRSINIGFVANSKDSLKKAKILLESVQQLVTYLEDSMDKDQ